MADFTTAATATIADAPIEQITDADISSDRDLDLAMITECLDREGRMSLRTKKVLEEYEITELRSHSPAPCADVFVSNIHFSVGDAYLVRLFSSFGTLVGMKLPKDSGVLRGYGFVKYSNAAEAERAVRGLAGFLLFDRALSVCLNTKSMMSERGFQSSSDSETTTPTLDDDRSGSRTRTASDRSLSLESEKSLENSMTLFLGNIPFAVDEKQLSCIVEQETGALVEEVRIMVDCNGRSRGFAYVDFVDKGIVHAALSALNGLVINDRVMRADYAKPLDRSRLAARVADDSSMATHSHVNMRVARTAAPLYRHTTAPRAPTYGAPIAMVTRPAAVRPVSMCFEILSTKISSDGRRMSPGSIIGNVVPIHTAEYGLIYQPVRRV
jgi:RNA recognition motif-containing protein